MTNPIRTAEVLPEPWQQEWPADGLEALTACPVCNHAGRNLLHDALVDSTFRSAAGRWTLWQCAGCGSGYQSPRPNLRTIHEAYLSYHTPSGQRQSRRHPDA
jgi:hypothetical protein